LRWYSGRERKHTRRRCGGIYSSAKSMHYDELRRSCRSKVIKRAPAKFVSFSWKTHQQWLEQDDRNDTHHILTRQMSCELQSKVNSQLICIIASLFFRRPANSFEWFHGKAAAHLRLWARESSQLKHCKSISKISSIYLQLHLFAHRYRKNATELSSVNNTIAKMA
jgi:hypothetical protein